MDEENAHAELVNVLQHIDEIRDNSPNVTKLVLSPHEIPPGRLSEIACRLLGRYIANNTHLQSLMFSSDLTDVKVVQLFQELTKSDSITYLNLGSFNHNHGLHSHNNTLGLNGVRSMTTFLQNSPRLIGLNLSANTSMNTAVFDVLVNVLNGRAIKELHLNKCSITDISSLGNVTLPHLQKLDLARIVYKTLETHLHWRITQI